MQVLGVSFAGRTQLPGVQGQTANHEKAKCAYIGTDQWRFAWPTFAHGGLHGRGGSRADAQDGYGSRRAQSRCERRPTMGSRLVTPRATGAASMSICAAPSPQRSSTMPARSTTPRSRPAVNSRRFESGGIDVLSRNTTWTMTMKLIELCSDELLRRSGISIHGHEQGDRAGASAARRCACQPKQQQPIDCLVLSK